VRDITARKEAEAALRASEERFRTLVRDLHVGVVLLGPTGTIQFANQAALDMFKAKIEQVVGRSALDLGLTGVREDGQLIPPSMLPTPRVLATRKPVRNEVLGWRLPNSKEILWIFGNSSPQLNKDGSIAAVIASFTNITELKRAEEALRQLSTRLLRLQDEERRRIGAERTGSESESRSGFAVTFRAR
jgi:PAS domain S-box-containing protein